MLNSSFSLPFVLMINSLPLLSVPQIVPLPFISADELEPAKVDGVSLRFTSNSGQVCNFSFSSNEHVLSIFTDDCIKSRAYVTLDKSIHDIQLNSVKISQPYGTEIFYRIKIYYGDNSDCFIGYEGKNFIEIGIERTGDLTASRVELIDCIYQTTKIDVYH